MDRITIDYGIDLGTTNSEIAVLRGTQPDMIPNQEGASFTPSAVWIDKRSQVFVGRLAKERFHTPDAALEFKLVMGQGDKVRKHFPSSGRSMLPEELSAEVLKSLKADVQRTAGEDLRAAVITVPAAFDLPQCDATRRAAELAGLGVTPLLLEPVAAALAYGFQSQSDKVFWLAYDFGGGTFDAAVIQVRDGIIQVVNHAGDNYLGGKNIDWDIVNKKLIPPLTAEYKLTEFDRATERWKPAIAKLKLAAEFAKIEVSKTWRPFFVEYGNCTYLEPPVCLDESGNPVELEFELTPQELEAIAAPYVARSINLCKKALAEARLTPKDMEKVLLVGGTSLLPCLRKQLEAELGIPLEASIDPITVVARGAAVFAGTQRYAAADTTVSAGTLRVELEYEPVADDTEPMVAGRVLASTDTDFNGWTVEFAEGRSQWRSGRIPLHQNGAFMTNVHAERGRRCEFEIILCDATGTRIPTVPTHFPYTAGMSVTNPPLTQSVGVATANNHTDWFFKKGEPLPARKTLVHQTVDPVRKGQAGDVIRIPVIEGEYERADRNRLIGYLEIPATDPRVRRDIPVGSEVEITINIDASRLVVAKVYVPVVDEWFDEIWKRVRLTLEVPELQREFASETERLQVVREKCRRLGEPRAEEALNRIEQENAVDHVGSLLEAAEGDPGAVGECDGKLRDLRAAIDKVEDAMEWPGLVKETKELMAHVSGWVRDGGNADEERRLSELDGELEKALESKEPDLLRTRKDDLWSLGLQVLDRKPEVWVERLEYLAEPAQKSKMQDQSQADLLFAQGRRAIENQDLEAIKAAVRQLWGLLPPPDQAEARGRYKGTTISFGRFS